MSHKLAKKIRNAMFSEGISITAEPYKKLMNGMVISSNGRRKYQQVKKKLNKEK